MNVYDYFNRLAGWTLCRVRGALPAAFLNRCASVGVELLSAVPDGDFTLLVRLRSRDLRRAERAARRSQCTLEPISSGGAPRAGRRMLGHVFGLGLLAAVLLLLLWSKLYIWEIQVTGNETVPTGRILDGLRECGVSEGTFWPGITSDNLRSALLLEVPELSWATVNIYGSRAEVLVRERTAKPAIYHEREPYDVVAGKAGFIRSVSAMNGTALVRPGQAVLAGETLISGAADSLYGGARRVHAAGTVTAETYYELTALRPLTETVKDYTGEVARSWALVLGKNRYYFFGNSSISPGSCDRITETWDLALGGVFSLPLGLERETAAEYVLTETERDQNLACRELEAELRETLLSRLNPGGTVEEAHFSATVQNGLLTVTLRARCVEDIAMERPME